MKKGSEGKTLQFIMNNIIIYFILSQLSKVYFPREITELGLSKTIQEEYYYTRVIPPELVDEILDQEYLDFINEYDD